MQIAAEENALQLINNSAHHTLKAFLDAPSQLTASNLVLVPALHAVIEYEMSVDVTINPVTMALCRWLFRKVYVVMKSLCFYGLPETVDVPEKPWQEVSD